MTPMLLRRTSPLVVLQMIVVGDEAAMWGPRLKNRILLENYYLPGCPVDARGLLTAPATAITCTACGTSNLCLRRLLLAAYTHVCVRVALSHRRAPPPARGGRYVCSHTNDDQAGTLRPAFELSRIRGGSLGELCPRKTGTTQGILTRRPPKPKRSDGR